MRAPSTLNLDATRPQRRTKISSAVGNGSQDVFAYPRGFAHHRLQTNDFKRSAPASEDEAHGRPTC
jgi:hypothetical protein